MALSLKHAFASVKGDGADASLVQPSNWNAEHTILMATARLLGRTTAGTGAVEELAAATVRTFLGLGALALLATVNSAALLDANVVETAAIKDANVTLAKLANMATASFLGRTTAASGVPEVLTATQATAMLNAFTTALKGLVPVPTAANTTDKAQLLADATWGMAHVAPDVILEDQKTSGTDGGTFTSGADRVRTLNTEGRDVLSICSLASNQFTLAAGTYYIEWSAPAVSVNQHQAFLYNASDASEVKRGTSISENNTTQCIPSEGNAVVTIAGAKAFEIRHRCSTTASTTGLGAACSFGTEIYTVVKIWKIA